MTKKPWRLSWTVRAFSDGEALDAVDSEKSRILLHELEPGWWILAVRLLFLAPLLL